MERHRLDIWGAQRHPSCLFLSGIYTGALISLSCLACLRPAIAQTDPYSIGMQYCQMVNNGIERNKAWDYVISNYANASPYGVNSLYGRSDPFAPWSPTRTMPGALGSGIGAGLASGIAMGMQLRRMKGDIQAVINQNCPGSEAAAPSNATQKPSQNKESADWQNYCFDNPWLKECGGQNTTDTTCPGCGGKEVNFPAKGEIQPEPQKLTNPSQKPEPSTNADKLKKQSAHQKCSKVADYSGCMKYNLGN